MKRESYIGIVAVVSVAVILTIIFNRGHRSDGPLSHQGAFERSRGESSVVAHPPGR